VEVPLDEVGRRGSPMNTTTFLSVLNTFADLGIDQMLLGKNIIQTTGYASCCTFNGREDGTGFFFSGSSGGNLNIPYIQRSTGIHAMKRWNYSGATAVVQPVDTPVGTYDVSQTWSTDSSRWD
jgi:hypothetical protein